MNDTKDQNTVSKNQWEAPQLIELDFGLDNIENGLNVGTDGAGGLTTSLS